MLSSTFQIRGRFAEHVCAQLVARNGSVSQGLDGDAAESGDLFAVFPSDDRWRLEAERGSKCLKSADFLNGAV